MPLLVGRHAGYLLAVSVEKFRPVSCGIYSVFGDVGNVVLPHDLLLILRPLVQFSCVGVEMVLAVHFQD